MENHNWIFEIDNLIIGRWSYIKRTGFFEIKKVYFINFWWMEWNEKKSKNLKTI